jgi:hypothetical protein
MPIGNLSSKIRQMLSTETVIIVALQPIAITMRNIPQKQLDKQQQTNREMQDEVVWQVLQPLTLKQHPES